MGGNGYDFEAVLQYLVARRQACNGEGAPRCSVGNAVCTATRRSESKDIQAPAG